jgi:hypothetical protein
MPTTADPLMARLRETHDLVRFTPDDNAALAYEVVVPKGWTTVEALGPAPEGFAQPRPIGHFCSDGGARASSVTVTVTSLPIEVDLEDWTLFINGADGWRVFASEWRQTPRGLVMDVGSTKGDAPERQVLRTMAHADNGRIFMVSGAAPEAEWDRAKLALLLACSSFKLLRPTGSDLLEPLLRWEGGDPRFGVAFPASWAGEEKASDVPGKSALDLRLADDERLLGYLRVKAIDRWAHPTTSDELLRRAECELATAGFVPGGSRISPAADPLGARLPGYAGTTIIEGQMWSQDVEARIGVRVGERLAFVFTSISVRQRVNPLLWMRAKRAFELVREHCWAAP